MKILIVDDSSLARRSMRQHLEALGYTVDEASDGMQALERFATALPDAVCLDMVMDGMKGPEVLAAILALDPAAKVLMATADIQDTTLDKVRTAGAKGIVNKPVIRVTLQRALDRILAGGEIWA